MKTYKILTNLSGLAALLCFINVFNCMYEATTDKVITPNDNREFIVSLCMGLLYAVFFMVGSNSETRKARKEAVTQILKAQL
jgi:branched-subunit amino acid permease